MGVKRAPARHRGGVRRPARCVVITVSDTRGPTEDKSGAAMARALERAHHQVLARVWVKDDVAAIRRAVRAALKRKDADAILLTGGSGIAPRDRTPEAVRPLLDRDLPGLGELFRALSYRQVGSAAWLSRAGAGISRDKLVVWLPGSPRAAELGVARLVAPELGHVLTLLERSP